MLKRFRDSVVVSGLLPDRAKLIVAVSGGIDSVVLLDLLCRLRPEIGWQLIVAHLDHAQRAESYEDAQFVGQLADHYNLRFVLGVLPPGNQSENHMRYLRHRWLEEVRREAGADLIVTAHHRGDRLETAVWHAIRGSDRQGLTSLGVRRGVIVRPLIGFGRGDIVTYAAARGLEWREDVTNMDRSLTRNTIRHELMHFAPTRDVDYHTNLAGWLDHLEVINDRINRKLDSLVSEITQPIEGGYELRRSVFLRLTPLVQLNVLAHLARRLTGGKGLTERNLDAAMRWLSTASSGSISDDLPGLLMLREYDTVKFVLRSASPTENLPAETQLMAFDTPIRLGRFELTLGEHGTEMDHGVLLIPQTYFVRTWQPGDRIQPIGMSGSKKIQDVFVDRKVPRSERLMWPIVVTTRNEVALVPHLARDRRFVPTGVDGPAHALHVKVV